MLIKNPVTFKLSVKRPAHKSNLVVNHTKGLYVFDSQ